MASEQSREVAPPSPDDKGLSDFASVIQSNLEDLFNALPDLKGATSAPTAVDGSIRSIRVVEVSGTWRLYIKVDATTWKYVALS
jgi:hypothetical protein